METIKIHEHVIYSDESEMIVINFSYPMYILALSLTIEMIFRNTEAFKKYINTYREDTLGSFVLTRIYMFKKSGYDRTKYLTMQEIDEYS